MYNPIFASHVTSAVRSSLYRSSLGKEVVGEDIADELKLVKFVDEKSTTQTIDKIQQGI